MKIVTLTLNPALDKSTEIDKLQPDKKLRCTYPTYEAGGGGINISRAIKILEGESQAIFAAGGPGGDKIQELLKEDNINYHCIRTKNPTRENLMVMEKTTDKHYRFGMPGNSISEQELQECIDAVKNLPEDVEYLVASGSLPPGVPVDFYGKIAEIAGEKNIECIVDTSGEALEKAVEMGVCLIKPNLRELSQLVKKEEIYGMEQEEIAKRIIDEGKVKLLIVSLGARGAMVASEDMIEYVVPPTVKQKSVVGAGDSMLGGIILSMSRGDDLMDSVKWGVAAGTAATMTPGSELCRKEDVQKIFEWLNRR